MAKKILTSRMICLILMRINQHERWYGIDAQSGISVQPDRGVIYDLENVIPKVARVTVRQCSCNSYHRLLSDIYLHLFDYFVYCIS